MPRHCQSFSDEVCGNEEKLNKVSGQFEEKLRNSRKPQMLNDETKTKAEKVYSDRVSTP